MMSVHLTDSHVNFPYIVTTTTAPATMSPTTCSQSENDTNNSLTSYEVSGGATGGGGGGCGKGFMLFGVRVVEGSFRKSASMNNLVQFEQQPQDCNADVAAGYESDDVVHNSARSRERKRGVAWTEEEHKLFLLGLQKVGKGDWRGISRNFVKSRTPTQVASHAQKYFLRHNGHTSRRRRRSSLFDITTDTFMSTVMEEQVPQETISQTSLNQPHLTNNPEIFPASTFPASLTPTFLPVVTNENPMECLTLGQSIQVTKSRKPIKPIPILPTPPSSKMADLSLNHTPTTTDLYPLSLKLSTGGPMSSSTDQNSPPPAKHGSASFQAMSGSFNSSSGDSIISVA